MTDIESMEMHYAMPEAEQAEFGMDDDGTIDVMTMSASMTAIGSVNTEEFEATQSAIATAIVEGDASVSASAIGSLNAASAGVHQALAGVMVVDGDVSIDQGGAGVIVANSVGVEHGGVGTLIAGDATLARSWVGVMAARNATLSDDSRVIIDARAALIIGGLLFGGFGLVAVAVYMAGRRIADRMPHLPFAAARHAAAADAGHMAAMVRARMQGMSLPHLADLPKMPDLSAVADMLGKLRRAA